MAGIEIINQRVREESAFVSSLKQEVGKVIVGQSALIDRLIIGLLTNGHVLLEGVPGLAKTLTIQTLSQALATDFQRIQFTPDLLPADLIGTLIYNQKEGDFIIKKGPVFSNIILADEINRAPAKVQSALLEAMQERQVTIGEETFALPQPFLVMATENPVEQEGTYPLPEAQVDRFMLKICVDYPSREEERLILDRMAHAEPPPPIQPIITPEQILRARQTVDEIYIDDKIKAYIIDLIFATREPEQAGLNLQEYIKYGASPRATISLTLAARAHAFMEGRGYVTPQDIKSVAPDVLRHRLLLTYEAEAEELTSDELIRQILAEIPVP
ncbi:MAG: ATPase [Kiritimatiellaceae bacterium]|jgi:MoxR-like ATPase|nr:ATPase [Kiritimatiellaceae bacterium]|tara:strand:+ start:45 stop:1031 length:987 start_codon:yes stop_codon:yes gene_type:complete